MILAFALALFIPAPVRQATVCDVSAHPTHYAGQRIRIVGAQYVSINATSAMLEDSRCVGRSLSVSLPNKFNGQKDLEKAVLDLQHWDPVQSRHAMLVSHFDGTLEKARVDNGSLLVIHLDAVGPVTTLFN
jgi:hypothetical protein